MGSDAITSSKSFLTYLLTASSLAVLSVLLLPGHRDGDAIASPFLRLHRTARVWPRLELSWRSALATAVGFLGSAFGTVGGVGGGGIFVPLLNLVVGFDTKSAAALSKCMIMGASMSSVWYNLRVPHPSREVPIIDYDLALLFQPMLMLGITIGVSLSVVFPYWLITVLIIILFMGTSSRSFFMAIHMWKQETLLKMEVERRMENPEGNTEGNKEALIDATEPLLSEKERTIHEILGANLRWKGIFVLMLVWSSFLLLQFLKARKKIPSAESAMVLAINFILFLQNGAPVCGALYWVVNILQFPVSVAVYVWEAMKLYRGSRRRRMCGNLEHVCEASIEWTRLQLLFCAFCGILGGTVGGLLGSGGGFILGPLLLEIGVIPQVASATATFVMMFSSSLSVVEFYFLKRFPIPYAAYLMFVSIIAGFWGQYLVRQLVLILRRASVIVFILSSVIFTSALVMGVIGIQTSIEMIKQHKYMGFLSFCDS